MKLFKKNIKPSGRVHEPIPEIDVTYNQVLDYLVGLPKTEYDRVIKVANVYREADKKAAQILGTKNTPAITLEGEATEEILDQLLDADEEDKK